MSGPEPARPTAAIFGCAGVKLERAERDFFRDTNPFGYILFSRNCESPEQVRVLVSDMREAVDRPDAPVLIDQEGGRVARLGPPHWRDVPPAARLGAVARRDLGRGLEAARLNARLTAEELYGLGISVNCAPVLDIPQPGGHGIIGDRAFGDDPELVVALGGAVAEGFLRGGVLPVIKHMPGHGRARADSHVELPVVDADRGSLEEFDFHPFRALSDMPWAMTAHVMYTAIDPDAPATISARLIGEVVRRFIGFDGVLISDDLAMSALEGSLADRAQAALAAGCDLVLHCTGERAGMAQIADAIGTISETAAVRLNRAEAMRANRTEIDFGDMVRRFDALIGKL